MVTWVSLLELSGALTGGEGLSYTWLRRTAVAVCHLLLWCPFCAAQEGSAAGAPAAKPGGPAASSTAPEGGIRERLPIIWVPDKDGKLQPLLNIPLEEIEARFFKDEKQGRAARPAPYSIQRLSITGTARGDKADLTAEVDVLVRADDWVAVPLRLDGAVMLEPARYQGPGEHYLQVDPQHKGYIACLRGQADQRHELTLKMLVPLTTMGRETRLELLTPRATVSDLTLSVPTPDAVGTVSEGATLEEPERGTNGVTKFTARGIGGDFQLAWHERGPRPQVPVQLEAVGAVLSRIGSRSVETNASLSVRSYGAPFDRFDVRLPPGAQLAEAKPPAGCTVEVLEEIGTSDPKRQLLAVRLERKTVGPVEVNLAVARPHHVGDPTEAFELAGFEVPGAVRQWGHVAVAAISDWQVDWEERRGVVRTDQLPEPLKHDELVAGYEYVAQPYSLRVKLSPRQTRIGVEPEYRLHVDAGLVTWDAKLKYTIRGAKAFDLSVALPDWSEEWQLDEVGPSNVVDADRVAVRTDQGSSPVLFIPLRQAASGPIEIRLKAHRALAEETAKLTAAVPRPLAATTTPAALWVLSADNVQLTPDGDATAGLMRQAAPPPDDFPEHQQEALFYRVVGDKATFAAGYEVRSRQIGVDVSSRLALTGGEAEVRQELLYTIAYEPAGHLTVEVPEELASEGRLEFQHERRTLQPAALGAADAENGVVRMQVALPAARIGPCRLVVRYPAVVPTLQPGRSAEWELPLVMPAEAELTGNRLEITPGRLSVEPADPRWNVSSGADGDSPRPGQVQLACREPVHRAKLTLKLENGEAEEATVVERAWVRTWLTDKAREDRAVFALRSGRRELRLHVPAGANLGQMVLRLDGKRVAAETGEDGALILTLPDGGEASRHLVEFESFLPQNRPPPGRLVIELPHLLGDARVHRLYWQLVLPQNEHVIAAPGGLIGENRWTWGGYLWRRRPLLDQQELEAWVDAPSRTPIPEGTNQYLFSSLGGVERCELRTAGRTWIVLIASGAALVAGLLLIYVPRSRHPGTLLVVGIVLLCVGQLWPEPTVLFAQAAGLGLALTLLAGLLERGVARRRRVVLFPEPGSAALEKGSSDTLYQPRGPGPGPSETTPPLNPPSHSSAKR